METQNGISCSCSEGSPWKFHNRWIEKLGINIECWNDAECCIVGDCEDTELIMSFLEEEQPVSFREKMILGVLQSLINSLPQIWKMKKVEN